MSTHIQKVRLSFPSIFRPSAFQEGQDPKFSATLIVDKKSPELKKIKEAMKKVGMERWGGKIPPNVKLCLRDGAEKTNQDGEYMDGFGPDVMFFNASNKVRPGVYDRDRSPLVEEDGKPYAGCHVNAIVEFWAQDNKFGKRINATLLGVQFDSDGDAFGGGSRAAQADDFQELEEAEDFGVDGIDEVDPLA